MGHAFLEYLEFESKKKKRGKKSWPQARPGEPCAFSGSACVWSGMGAWAMERAGRVRRSNLTLSSQLGNFRPVQVARLAHPFFSIHHRLQLVMYLSRQGKSN